jgi:hypothetical protein
MRRLFLLFLAMATPAAAEDVSPWFGSTDQVPFQLAADGSDMAQAPVSAPDTRAATGDTDDCAITGCSLAEGSAKVLGAGLVSP